MINKCQERNLRAETVLRELHENHSSLIEVIDRYFQSGPEIIVLPDLQWDYGLRPNFEVENFFLTYDHIRSAQSETSRKMMKGLIKIQNIIKSPNAFTLPCDSFEDEFSQLYSLTSENEIAVGVLEYRWTLMKAKIKLRDFVTKVDMLVAKLRRVFHIICIIAE